MIKKSVEPIIQDFNGIKIYKTKLDSKYKLISGSDWQAIKDILPGLSGQPYDEIWVENEYIKMLREYGGIFINDAFLDLVHKTQGLLFLAGGYGSSKTTYAITRLLLKCVENKYFKCFYGRQHKTTARELHDNICREIERNGWKKDIDFDYSMKPNGTTDIVHIPTGNMFRLFGCDDDESLKGIDNPTDIFVDEINQLSFESFGMLVSRLRTPGCELQLTCCFNNCDVYEDHWIYKYIYIGEEPRDAKEKLIVDTLKKMNLIKHHSKYTDNKFVNPEQYLQTLILKAAADPDKIKAYCEGAWGVRLNAQPYYKQFKFDRDVYENAYYNPKLPLHVSFDENANPYLPCLISQIDGLNINLIDEIAAANPNNTLEYVCAQIRERYPDHDAGMYIYGDATSKKQDVKLEKGQNLFTLAATYLKKYNPELRVDDSNPSNSMRGKFINVVFATNYGGLKVRVSSTCLHMIMDFQNVMEDPKGNGKDKTTKMVNGIRGVQEYGHFGDAFDYFITRAMINIYLLYQAGDITHIVSGGGRVVNHAMDSSNTAVLSSEFLSLGEKEIIEDEDDEYDYEDYEEAQTEIGRFLQKNLQRQRKSNDTYRGVTRYSRNHMN